MGRRIQLEPGWLVALLVRWALKDIPGRQLGYASGSSWMRGLKSSPATSIDSPTDFTGQDFGDAENGMSWLHDAYQPDWAALMMYYKPWTINALEEQGFPSMNDRRQTYYDRLHEGHAKLARHLNNIRDARAEPFRRAA